MIETGKAPLHLWIVGVLSALWNGFGCADYTMTQTKNEAWLSALSPETRTWIDTAPAWADAAWALGVWGGLAGSVLLLMRSRHAVTAFIVSLSGLAVSTYWQFGANDGAAIMGDGAHVVNAVIWVIGIALLLYARQQRKVGVLG